MRSLSRPLSVSRDTVQFVEGLGAGRRSVLPDAAPGCANQKTGHCQDGSTENKDGEKLLHQGCFILSVSPHVTVHGLMFVRVC